MTEGTKAASAAAALGLIVLGVALTRPPARELADFRIVSDMAYDTAFVQRGYRTHSIHLVSPDGRRFNLPERHWPGDIGETEFVRRLNARRVATVWLRGGETPGAGYPTIKGVRTGDLFLDPQEALRIDRRDHRILLFTGPALLLLALGILYRGRKIAGRPV